MASVNKVTLLGNLGRDPEARTTQAGGKIVTRSLATSETWNDRASGERKERTEWHRVVIFNEKLAELAERYLRKGSKVYVEGALQTRKWTDQSGQEKHTTEVVPSAYSGKLVLLDGRSGDDAAEPAPAAVSRARAPRRSYASAKAKGGLFYARGAPASSVPELVDDDLPF